MPFDLVSEYSPQGDQPKAIEALTRNLLRGEKSQVLMGVTGSGKTFTVANVIRNLDRPTLVISHNKTLAAQLYSEFKQFFPNNAVEYFVSYFDYYQPEAYIPRTDTYIEKDSSINEEIERMRLSTTSSLLSRRDVIVVSSVSCIYGLGSPEDYYNMIIPVEVGQRIPREALLTRLVDTMYNRNDIQFTRGNFRVRGDTVEIALAYQENALRVEFFGDEIDRITEFDPLTGHTILQHHKFTIFPAKAYVTPADKLRRAITTIGEEMHERVAEFEKHEKLLEAQRIKQRTMYDIEMLQEMGFCSGIENYSRHLTGRPPGSRPYTLFDFFPKDYLLVIDESHVTIPQIGGMYEGDRSRKNVLVDHGFRLKSALDNRPLNFAEFEGHIHQALYVSATPGKYELMETGGRVVEQIIRPTGLVDPPVEIRPLKNQIDDVIAEIQKVIPKQERVLILTLTKKTAEDLTDYLRDIGVRVRYLHSEIDAIERVEILRALREGNFDVLVGINLLREGLDLPEVSLVAVLDADKEGFLRSERSLIQITGRAARHVNGRAILYAEKQTDSIRGFMKISGYRRERQLAYNKEHGITPRGVARAAQKSLQTIVRGKEEPVFGGNAAELDKADLIRELSEQMMEAAKNLEYERAALLRDQIEELKKADIVSAGKAPSEYAQSQKAKRKKSERAPKIKSYGATD
ncbi:excinuclease ABC subunit UvrB [Oscillatoria laete-virens NRMC-F 0139]|nr:excinuclease ABC subunit UvrB [Oscillatoria laete-virens]MDL5052983.1 excinuclease ABC subunit UvrB [Oscillatoria laete-virens NRMC-F 0139]